MDRQAPERRAVHRRRRAALHPLRGDRLGSQRLPLHVCRQVQAVPVRQLRRAVARIEARGHHAAQGGMMGHYASEMGYPADSTPMSEYEARGFAYDDERYKFIGHVETSLLDRGTLTWMCKLDGMVV